MSTLDLIARAEEIRTETIELANSANRVGALIKDIASEMVSTEEQTLSDAQKAKVRENIGAQPVIDGALNTVDKTVPGAINELKVIKLDINAQTFTDLQQTQARTNINAVGKSGNETIGGVKTFSLSPVVPAATNNTDSQNKGGVESQITARQESARSQSTTKSPNSKLVDDELSLLGNLLFRNSLNPIGRNLDEFTSFINQDYWSENGNWFDQKYKIFDKLSIRAYANGNAVVGLFVLNGTTSTKISDKTITLTTGVNHFSLSDITDAELTEGVKCHIFIKDNNNAVGYTIPGDSNGGLYILIADETTVNSFNIKIGMWVETKAQNQLNLQNIDLQNDVNILSEINLPEGIYTITQTLVIPSGKRLIGIPGKTIIQADSNVTPLISISGVNDVLIDGITFKGSSANVIMKPGYFAGAEEGVVDTFEEGVLETNVGTKKGIYINASERVIIRNCEVCNFDKYGIEVLLSGKYIGYGFRLDNLYIHDCYIGVKTDSEAEYSTINAITATHCQIGAFCNSGNNIWSSSHFDNNRIGAIISDGYNNSHGSFVGCTFNHNSLYGLAVNEIHAGEIISACQFWYGDIYVKGSRGPVFNACEIATQVFADGNYDGSYGTGGMWMICNSIFLGGAIYQNYNGNTSNLKLKNNWFMDGGDSASINN
jgi:hypothetical protein